MRLLVLLISIFCIISASAQDERYLYRLSLRDKSATEYDLSRPELFLSQKSLERRSRQNIPLDSTDLPVPSAYLKAIEASGLRVVATSRWCNTVLVETMNASDVEGKISALPFIVSTRQVYHGPVKPEEGKTRKERAKEMENNPGEASDNYYGASYDQCLQLGGTVLHEKGFRGEGMTIAVIDGGYYNADMMTALENTKILGTKDFVNPSSDIYSQNSHGMMVLSCMGARWEGRLVGTAPEASYYLLRSEDTSSEQPVEEDYWCAAAEYADSLGVDLITTSLGYNDFDGEENDLPRYMLDGWSSQISRGGTIAARKGMVVCVSAGNSGGKAWKKITPPADSFGVLTVGAVKKDGVNSDFSSVGNTQDGRIKPDVMARGVASALLSTSGNVSSANGTSFSTPIMAGLVACLWQGLRDLTSDEIIELVKSSASNAEHPDNIMGYGIPDMAKAYQAGLSRLEEKRK